MSTKSVYTYDDALAASIEYFKGDELAAKVFLDKYALRDNDQNLLERTPEDMHRRIAREFARVEKQKFKHPLTEGEIFSYLDRFAKIVPQGSPMYGIGNKFQYISLSNCFVVESPQDSYSGICKTDEELVQISKRRGGVGVDISNFRPSGSITHNAARTSTGITPLQERYSNSIREVGQNGRRGAEMQTISIHHPEAVTVLPDGVEPQAVVVKNEGKPDINTTTEFYNPAALDFSTIKYDNKRVTGANISIRFSDEFLRAVDEDTEFEQRWPVDSKEPKFSRKVSAKKAWKKIVQSAWQMAEPGILFWDNILRESPADCYAEQGFKTISTNPCGEIPLSAFDSCRLLLLNLFGFVKNPFTRDAYFDYAEFYYVAQIAQRLMDDLIDLEVEAITGIMEKIISDPEPQEVKQRELDLWDNILHACRMGRRTGTGITALGDALAATGVAYGSEDGIETTERIYKTLKFAAYRSSVEMAKELGPFPVWDHEKEKNCPFFTRMRDEDCALSRHPLGPDLLMRGSDLWDDMKKYGRRNIALLTTAPAGTVSIETQTSSGIEPQYSIDPITRRKKGNPGDKNFRSDFVDQNGDHWQEFIVYPPKLKMWMEVTGQTDINKSPWRGSCANEIDWTLRVKLQAAAQKHVDHSISSTLNLPNDVTVDKVDEIYRAAWKAGCKGVTIYRDGCRTGVLVRADEEKGDDSIQKTDAPKRPATLPCDVHHLKARGEEYFVLVGLLNGDPFEVFAGKNGMIGKSVKAGTLTKESRKKYHAVFDDGTELKDVVDHISDEEEAITRLVSLGLRHGADIAYTVHQLEKVRGDMLGFAKAMARALKKYIADGTEVKGESCPECQNDKMVRAEGCVKCPACGWTKCS
jgi:ribonucleoside-diphosphate reductase alpha chain